MKIVLIQGAFEILNAGHVQVFKRCREQGDYLIVALNTNALLKKYKGRDAVLPWREKKMILDGLASVNRVVPAHRPADRALLEKYGVDVYCLSREWEAAHQAEIKHMKQKGGEIFFTHDYKITRTRQIKRILLEEAQATGAK